MGYSRSTTVLDIVTIARSRAVRIRDFSRSGMGQAAGKFGRVSGAKQRAQRLFPTRSVRRAFGEWADPPALGETQRCLPRAAARFLARLAAILVVDAGRTERRAHPPLAEPTPDERRRAGGGEGPIVDIAERRHS